MKEQMRIELHNETEYTERISFQDIWTHASKLKHVGCRVAAITDRNSWMVFTWQSTSLCGEESSRFTA